MSADKTEISEADVIASNHYSVHLDWSSSLLQFKYYILSDSERIYTILQQTEGTLEEENEWKNVYTGYGENTIVEDLKPYQEYLFRIRFHRSDNNYTNWSPPIKVITEKEPYYGESLHKAIRNRRSSEVENVLKSGIMEMLLSFNASVNGKDESGKTALMHACIHGQLPAVKMLLNNGALYNDFDLGGSSPLHYAVDSCKCELIEWMIKDGADVNIQDRNAGWTPLIRCVWRAIERKRHFEKVDICLPVFSHGQLYVALSHTRRKENFKILLKETSSQEMLIADRFFTKNLVIKELLN
uniref:Fibronectin type-III domain-containing protein n=1 Tax=Octopus bimaculoides TaxID=37653 RepID=A0A0L8HVD3_OCTBM